jgi:biopolymer transport protein ExbD
VSTGAEVSAQRLTDLLLALRGIAGLSVQVLVPS